MHRILALVMTAAIVAISPGSAQAGGSVIEFEGPAIVGTVVTGSGLFGNGQQAPVSAGPWFAELRSSEGAGIDPIPLGTVDIRKSAIFGWRAAVTFAVPDVPIGTYWIVVNNARGEGVGDLAGGVVLIANTPAEAALWKRATHAEQRAEMRGRWLRGLRERDDQLQATLEDRQATVDRQIERLTTANVRIADLGAQLSATDPASSPMPVWPLVLAGLGLAALGFVVGRRYATRTLVTGASRSWTENQEAPLSAEPKTSPLVAPK
jgi:hypothetical protein